MDAKGSNVEEFNADKLIQEFETLTKDAGVAQQEVLRKILEENSETEYLKGFGLLDRKPIDTGTFQSMVPLSTYENIRGFMDRVVNGDTSPMLSTRPIIGLCMSTGTSKGKPKSYPVVEGMADVYIKAFSTSCAYRSREFHIDNSKKSLQFMNVFRGSKTETGIKTGIMFGTYVFPGLKRKLASVADACSPYEVINSPDPDQALYCHLLCGLIFREEIQYIYALFVHTIIVGFRSLEQTWEPLVDDIRTGVLSTRITIPSLREAMSKILTRPEPKLAEEIYQILVGLSTAKWRGLIPKLFPNAKYVTAVLTGVGASYVSKLKEYALQVPLVGYDYGSSECMIGININPKAPPELVNFTIIPNSAYFEFIPLENGDHHDEVDNLKTVGLTEVEVGKEYELVVTNIQGLYRYKVGDIVKVTGFHNSSPQVQYMGRANILLSIYLDKIKEKDLRIAIEHGTNVLIEDGRMNLAEFTSYAEKTSGKEHYIIYWELDSEPSGCSDEALKRCSTAIDLGFVDPGYIMSRKSRSIGALELRVVEGGTFANIIQHFSGSAQFKMPRSVTRKDMLDILDERVYKSYLSSAYKNLSS